MSSIWIPLIIFFAAFTQGLTGFGTALVAMPLLVNIIGLSRAAPLVSLVGSLVVTVVLIRYRAAFNWRAMFWFILASVIGAPLGVIGLEYIDENIAKRVLGLIISGYAVYALMNFYVPELKHGGWALGFGFLSGMFGGAYNTSGPPIIIYGNCRRWQLREFKANLQGFFFVNTAIIVSSHTLKGNYTLDILRSYLFTLPFVLLGLWLGFKLSEKTDPQTFHRIILVLLLLLGLSLAF